MIEVIRAIEIDAPAAAVWRVLTDLPGFRAWNPFIRAARGDLAVGGDVRVRVRSSVAPLPFHATVLGSEENRELHWRGHFLWPWLGSGEHWFEIEPLEGGRVRFVQREVFRGLLPRLARRLLEREAGWGFDAMNRELKARAEREGSARWRAPAAV